MLKQLPQHHVTIYSFIIKQRWPVLSELFSSINIIVPAFLPYFLLKWLYSIPSLWTWWPPLQFFSSWHSSFWLLFFHVNTCETFEKFLDKTKRNSQRYRSNRDNWHVFNNMSSIYYFYFYSNLNLSSKMNLKFSV